MENPERYFITEPMPDSHDVDENGKTIRRNIVWLNDTVLPESKQFFTIVWYTQPHSLSHESHICDVDEFVGFIGSDPENPQELNGRVRFWLNGKWITIEKSAIIYVPAGMPHCPYVVEAVDKPMIHFAGSPYGHLTRTPCDKPAEGFDDPEKYVSYEPRPFMPGTETDPSILRKAVWLDSRVIPGAPYIEFAWFLKPRGPKPPTHVHDFDEIVGFIGSDPDDPGDLGATLNFNYDGEVIRTDRSVVVYMPAGVHHCPFLIEDMKRPILSFSGGDGNRY